MKSAIKVNRILHLGKVDVTFCIFYVYRIMSNFLELNLTFVSNIVEKKAENYKNCFIKKIPSES